MYDGVASAVGNVFESLRSVFVGSGEDYAYEFVAPGLGGGGEGVVDCGAAEEVWLLDGERECGVVFDEEVVVGRRDVDVASFDGLLVVGFDDVELGFVVECLDETGSDVFEPVHAYDDGEREVGWEGGDDFGHHGVAACGASYDDCLVL